MSWNFLVGKVKEETVTTMGVKYIEKYVDEIDEFNFHEYELISSSYSYIMGREYFLFKLIHDMEIEWKTIDEELSVFKIVNNKENIDKIINSMYSCIDDIEKKDIEDNMNSEHSYYEFTKIKWENLIKQSIKYDLVFAYDY